MGKQPRRVLFYTGPDCDNAKTGEYHSVKDWGDILHSLYSTFYYQLFRSKLFRADGYLSQGRFNQYINPKAQDDPTPVWDEIDPGYLRDKELLREKVIAELNKGRTTAQIAAKLHTNTELVTRIRSVMGKEKATKLTQKHKCKCPTCGQIYYRTGFYTGTGLWRKMHDKGECKIQGDSSRRQVYKDSIHVTGLDLNSNTSVF